MHDADIDDGGPSTHAMTEIALALAMGFFCVLVLALISMGAGGAGDRPAMAVDVPRVATSGSATARPLDADEILLIHRDGRFLDAQGRQVAPGVLPQTGRVVLAVDPARPIQAALAARAKVPAEQVTLTTLDAAWIAALAEGARQ